MAGNSGIKVRGSCPDGHITEAITTGNRITWRGKCSQENCAHTITARRIPRDQVPTEPAAPASTEAAEYPFIEVDSYGKLPDRPHTPDAGVVVESDPATAGSAGDGGRAAAEGQGADERPPDPITDDLQPTIRERLRARPRGQWQHPLT